MPRSRDLPHWQPGASQKVLRQRGEVLSQIRKFMRENGILEVETPMLSAAGNSDPGIAQLVLETPRRFLRTSPEYAMKRLLAAGSGDIFELGRVFRAGEQGRHHNPEFTMLEWYRCGWSYQRLMDEVSALVRFCLPDHELAEARISYREAFRARLDIDPFTATDRDVAQRVGKFAYDGPPLDRNAMLDLLMSHAIQPNFDDNALTFVFDYPPDQAALARIRPDNPPVAERFELFLGTLELANGYQELTDADEQRHRFEAENARAAAQDLPATPLDQRLLAALSAGLPDCAGVALGVDRLLMRRVGAKSLDEVLAFGADRA